MSLPFDVRLVLAGHFKNKGISLFSLIPIQMIKEIVSYLNEKFSNSREAADFLTDFERQCRYANIGNSSYRNFTEIFEAYNMGIENHPILMNDETFDYDESFQETERCKEYEYPLVYKNYRLCFVQLYDAKTSKAVITFSRNGHLFEILQCWINSRDDGKGGYICISISDGPASIFRNAHRVESQLKILFQHHRHLQKKTNLVELLSKPIVVEIAKNREPILLYVAPREPPAKCSIS
jgi:hypothetical protein